MAAPIIHPIALGNKPAYVRPPPVVLFKPRPLVNTQADDSAGMAGGLPVLGTLAEPSSHVVRFLGRARHLSRSSIAPDQGNALHVYTQAPSELLHGPQERRHKANAQPVDRTMPLRQTRHHRRTARVKDRVCSPLSVNGGGRNPRGDIPATFREDRPMVMPHSVSGCFVLLSHTGIGSCSPRWGYTPQCRRNPD